MDNNLNDMLDKMKEYRSASPEFSDAIKVLGTDTPNHAEAVNAATRQLLDNTVALKNEMACNLLYLPDAVNSNSAGGASWQGGRFLCNIPSEDIRVWNGEIALPEGGYAYPATSASAEVLVVYELDDAEHQVEISAGAVLPEEAVVTEYRLERKDGESRIIADIWPMISPGKRPVVEYVPYTGDGGRINRCMAEIQKKIGELKKSASDGKSAVASAITEMGVSTASDAAFGAIAENIEKIKPTITVGGGVSGTWSGATFTYGGGCGGSASINGKNTATATATIASKSTTAGGNAKASDVLSGKTFSSNNAGREIAGSMPNQTNVRKTLTGSNNSAENGGYSISGSTMRVCPATGYHDYTNTAWENCMQIEVGNASASDVLAGKRFTSSAGRNVEGNIINARATGAKQFGASFPVASSGYPYFCLWYLDHIGYNQFNLHYVINTSGMGSIFRNSGDGSTIRVGGTGGTINVLRSDWTFDATNYNRMVVSLYGKSDYVGSSMEFRGCVGVCAKGATYSTAAEGREYAMRYGSYEFTSTTSAWHSNIVVDLSGISQWVQFHMSTVHSGEVRVSSIGFIPN